MERGDDVIRLKKEVSIDTSKVTPVQMSNYWRSVRGDKSMKKQQLFIAVPNPYSVNPDKPFISYKYNNQM